MIKHKEEIFSRPKRTWFATEREKNLIAKAAKVGACCLNSVTIYKLLLISFVW